jgi:predicted Zn-dependent protease
MAAGTPQATEIRIMVGETQARNPALLHAAQQNLEDLSRSEPDNPGVHAALGRIFRDAGLTEKAQAAFARVIALDPANREATAALAELKASGPPSR